MKIEDLKGISALRLLSEYKGKNPYIKKLKYNHENTRGGITLTTTQSAYILDNYENEPILINRVVAISDYLGLELQKIQNLSFKPERILIEYMLAETEKSFHIYGKLKRNQDKSAMYFIPKSQVMDDPYFEPIEVEVDFDKYTKLDTFKLKDGTIGRKPYKHQIEGIKFLLGRNGCILADDMGLGKAQPLDSKILTPYGWVNMGDLSINDEVIGSNGKPTKILGVFPQGKKDIYKITFTDGSTVESCDEHLWAVQTPVQKYRGSSFQVKTLRDIMSDITQSKNKNIKWFIPMVKPVIFSESPSLNIDPYVMGCLLGDGGFSGHNIKFSSIDEELITEISNRLPYGHKLDHINGCDYHLTGYKNTNQIIRELNEYKLMGLTSEYKFIPNYYKYSDLKDRLNILQGLMDTDGYVSKSGTIQFYSVSRQLTDDVKELVQSFGGVARETNKIGEYKLPDGTIKKCKICFILTINLPEDIIPFKLQRKIDRLNNNKKYFPSRGIKSIEFSRVAEAQCISVDAEDSLYVTNNYVVTHNTYQSIIAALESGAERVLIVCPSSVKINWEREINYFQCFDTSIIAGKKWSQAKFTIINYDILKNFHEVPNINLKEEDICWENQHLVQGKFDLCIIDEAHYLKDHTTIRGSIMKDLCVKHNIPKVWLLTGTPVANRPKDFYNLLALIKAPIANDWMFYVRRYCEAKSFFKTLKNGRKKKIWLTNGASNLDELNRRTKNLFLRRMKTDIDDMPDKIITPVYHELSSTEKKEYENLWEEYLIERKKKKKRGNVERELVELILLRQYIAKITVPKTIELVENALEQDQKVIIFTNFTDELQELHKHFGSISVIHYGEMSDSKKQASVDAFQQNPEKRVFIGNIKSAGVGITLTEGTIVVFNSFDWVPGNNEQAEDRSYRIGQTNHVNVYYQLFDDTIATKMWDILSNKKDVISRIINGAEKNDVDDDELISLIIDKIIEE